MSSKNGAVEVRALERRDLDAVIAIDREITGRSRRGYFERRLASALRDPKCHLQIAAVASSGLVGFALARITSGEFGRAAPAVLLESIGVAPASQHAGLGRRMMGALEARARSLSIGTLVTQADWRAHAMLRFIEGAGFLLAPRLVLARKVARMPLPPTDEEIEREPPVIRNLRADDFERIVRIDTRATGRDRTGYFQRKFDEALNESAVLVSLVVEDDGFAVGFAMARVDLGDFGNFETTAALDSLAIDPPFARKGYARDLMRQLVDNLAALNVERLETEVAHDHFELLRFFYAFGFVPAQRLVLQKAGSLAPG